nr:hypothetical protein [Tanacetum cinerariifolium]
MSTPGYVDSKTITHADRAQSSRVPVPLPNDPYVVVRHAQLVDTYNESELKVALLEATTRMTVRVQPAMSPGHSAKVAEAMALSDSAFHKREILVSSELFAIKFVMDPNSSLGKICLGENVVEISSVKVEGSGDWNSPEFQDTANSRQKKETKAMVFHQMDTKEVSDRFIAPCFVNGLEVYDEEINLGVEENMISNEYAVKLCLKHEVKRENKVVKKELIVALRGENVVEISSVKVEGSGDWNSPEFQDTANSRQKKETKAMVFHQMDTKEVSDRFIAPCFVNGLEVYDEEINLGVEENMISNEYAVKLCLKHEVKRENKVVKKELIVALR